MNVDIIGVPLDLGANRRGVDMGPSAIRYANLMSKLKRIGIEATDLGDIPVPTPESHKVKNKKLKYLPEIVKVNETLTEVVEESMANNKFPLILGGDHSIAMGAIAGVAKGSKGELGIIWFDAHGDFNTDETTYSGNIHGMSLAASLGYGHNQLISIGGSVKKVKEENVVLIGVRSLDKEEKNLLKDSRIKVFTMDMIDKEGMAKIIDKTLKLLSHCDSFHVSFDMDVIDPNEAPGVGTPISGGLTYREANLAVEILAMTNKVKSAEFVEVNPILDNRNKTAELTVTLISSLLGEKIL